MVEEVRLIMLGFHREGQLAILRSGFAEIDLRDLLPDVSVPTLLLYGDADVRSPKDVAEAMHAAIPGSRLVFLPGAGHLCDVEAPEPFNSEVRGFLRKI